MYDQNDAAADSMKATMEASRREAEAEGAILLCASCDNEASPGSCYCKECEERDRQQEEQEQAIAWSQRHTRNVNGMIERGFPF